MNEKIAHITLFKNHGTSVGYWEAWVDQPVSGGAHIVIQHARSLEGRATAKIHPVKGKNLGRSNETTPLEQAKLEVESRTNKQLDKGYVRKFEDASAPSTNTLGLEKPMLAQPMDKVKSEDIDWSNAYAQPKLDGHRAMFKDGQLYSRQGKIINLPHITAAIEKSGLSGLHLDGELYLHGESLQSIGSLVKRLQPDSEKLVYHIYDTVNQKLGWRLRVCGLPVIHGDVSAIEYVPYFRVETNEDLQKLHGHFLEEGYEGTMLRWGDAGYQDGKRSKHLIKLKNFKDAEFRIVGVKEGVPNGKYRVPVWICEAHNGETFSCTAQGNMKEKHELAEAGDVNIGRLLTVKYHYLSKDGIPQLPVALRFREDV